MQTIFYNLAICSLFLPLVYYVAKLVFFRKSIKFLPPLQSATRHSIIWGCAVAGAMLLGNMGALGLLGIIISIVAVPFYGFLTATIVFCIAFPIALVRHAIIGTPDSETETANKNYLAKSPRDLFAMRLIWLILLIFFIPLGKGEDIEWLPAFVGIPFMSFIILLIVLYNFPVSSPRAGILGINQMWKMGPYGKAASLLSACILIFGAMLVIKIYHSWQEAIARNRVYIQFSEYSIMANDRKHFATQQEMWSAYNTPGFKQNEKLMRGLLERPVGVVAVPDAILRETFEQTKNSNVLKATFLGKTVPCHLKMEFLPKIEEKQKDLSMILLRRQDLKQMLTEDIQRLCR